MTNQEKVLQEQNQASEVESRMEKLRQEGEDRVCSLEAKLSQLSDMVRERRRASG